MTTKEAPLRHRLYGFLILAICLPGTTGCAVLPPLLEQGYAVLSGISYLATSKGPTDHAISFAARKDCSPWRLLLGRPICMPVTEKSNRPLLVTLIDLMDLEPVDLPPAELLAEFPPPVDPRITFHSAVAQTH